MQDYLKDAVKAISLKHLVFIICLGFAILDFLISLSFEYTSIRPILEGCLSSSILAFLCISVLIMTWVGISLFFKQEPSLSLRYSLIVLSPTLLLSLWRPEGACPSPLLPLAISLSAQIGLFIILSRQGLFTRIDISRQKAFVAACVLLYLAFFGYIGIRGFNSFSFFNPKDFAIYNQSFWNTIHARPFQNSTYGSNFTCHNTVFFFLLVPFYYIFPHPLSLLILKTALLSLSAVPFYLIARHILRDNSAVVLTVAYMFYPFLVSQNFAPPHEICFLPLFMLSAYYFYRLKNFGLFMLFLILSVSIKEHLSLIALAFGLYSLLHKRGPRWVLAPILLGVAWCIFSLAVISHFQRIYHAHPQAAWFMPFLKSRFFSGERNIFGSVARGLSYSNLGSWYNLKSISLLFSPLGIIAPLLSPVGLLGLPELIINLISDRPAMLSPLRHYNIAVSCFLLIAAAEGIKRLSDFKGVRDLKIEASGAKWLLSVFILASTLIHSYLWLGLITYSKDTGYIKTVKEAISIIPPDAFIAVPDNAAVHVSGRRRYSLIRDREYGDYILIDKGASHMLRDKEIINNYVPIFGKLGVWVLVRKG